MSSLSNRMKNYEHLSDSKLLPKTPVILRIDGKSFHTFTKEMQRPWDERLAKSMWEAAIYTCKRIMGAQLAYTQSDECNIFISDWESNRTQAWFEYRLQKLCSISAGLYTAAFLRAFCHHHSKDPMELRELPIFDARAFNLPKHEVANYFIWRQQDACRNSLQMLARVYFSHSETLGKTNQQLQEMLWKKHQINWNDCEIWQKRGMSFHKRPKTEEKKEKWGWVADHNTPMFSQHRNYIERHLNRQTRNQSIER